MTTTTDTEARYLGDGVYGKIEFADGQTEEWRDIPGYEGRYRVSSLGRVMSLERRVRNGFSSGSRIVKQRILKQYDSKERSGEPGPRTLKLHKDCARHNTSVAHLVLLAFAGPPAPGQVPFFINGDIKNATAENLRWEARSWWLKNRIENHRR